MLIGEPGATAADIHFRCFGIPVRVHPLFWAVALLLGMRLPPKIALLWVVAVFLSILVHELGHAFAFRHFGAEPRITLYGLGGLASADYVHPTPKAAILIALAGPAAGFLLALLLVSALVASGHGVGFSGLLPVVDGDDFGSPILFSLVTFLLVINVFWGLLNLLPVYPLDGGQIARELFTMHDAGRGIVRSLWLSSVTAVAVAVLALMAGQLLPAFLFGYLAYWSYRTQQAYSGRGYGSGW